MLITDTWWPSPSPYWRHDLRCLVIWLRWKGSRGDGSSGTAPEGVTPPVGDVFLGKSNPIDLAHQYELFISLYQCSLVNWPCFYPLHLFWVISYGKVIVVVLYLLLCLSIDLCVETAEIHGWLQHESAVPSVGIIPFYFLSLYRERGRLNQRSDGNRHAHMGFENGCINSWSHNSFNLLSCPWQPPNKMN